MQIELVGVHGNGRVFELNDYFHAVTFRASRKVQQRMLVEEQLGADAVEARGGGFGHSGIVKQRKLGWA